VPFERETERENKESIVYLKKAALRKSECFAFQENGM
jgi:hypothetical protein